MAKILLVEDNEMNRDMLSRRLIRRGFEVIFAVDGKQGVDAARREKPDIILMDMSLPVMDGWEATRKLKADPQTRPVPIIALTAHAMKGDRERCLEAGMDGYVSKPVQARELQEAIDAVRSKAEQPAIDRADETPIHDVFDKAAFLRARCLSQDA